jgi:hypothetical protein
VTNTVAYYKKSLQMAVKSFKTWATSGYFPNVNVINMFTWPLMAGPINFGLFKTIISYSSRKFYNCGAFKVGSFRELHY